MRINGFLCGLVMLVVMMMGACSSTPSGVLPEKKMQAVMTDMLTAEALAAANVQAYRNDSLKAALYASVLRKHGIDRAAYDSSLVWYGRNLEVYMQLHDRILNDLQKRTDSLK
jgi:hypothetical protein